MEVQLAAGALSLLFLSAALGKVDGWRTWQRSASELFSVPAVAIAIPIVEAACGALLLVVPRAGLACAAGLLAVFGGAVLLLVRTHAGRDCNCFGALAPSSISRGLAARDLALAMAAGAAFASGSSAGGPLPLGLLLVMVVVGSTALLAGEAVKLRGILNDSKEVGGV